jgi:protein-disulfide isomerase
MKRCSISTVAGYCFVLFCLSHAATSAAEDIGAITKDAQSAILGDLVLPRAGAAHPDVLLVEYFDYNCPFCKKLNPALQDLLKADTKVAIVYKDWPIFGGDSLYAARLALAANWQGKYLPAHDALMGATRLASEAQIDELLRHAGLNMTALKKDRDDHAAQIDALLKRDDTEAHGMGIRGTPGLLVGRHIINGVYDVAGLKQAVEIARSELSR